MPQTVSEYDDDGLAGKTRSYGKENCYSCWNRASAIQCEPVKVLTELPSTFLRKFDVKVWNGFSWITVCADNLHTVMNHIHSTRRADFLYTMNNHKLFKNITHVVFSRNIYFHVVCVFERV